MQRSETNEREKQYRAKGAGGASLLWTLLTTLASSCGQGGPPCCLRPSGSSRLFVCGPHSRCS